MASRSCTGVGTGLGGLVGFRGLGGPEELLLCIKLSLKVVLSWVRVRVRVWVILCDVDI